MKAKDYITIGISVLALGVGSFGALTHHGRDGINGADGINGINGVDGTNGKDGQTPYIGENGHWWIGTTDTGVNAKGQDGKDGQDGRNGLDGQNGQDGKDGKDGKDGTNGSNGTNGSTPYIINGYWWIDGKNTGIKAIGQDGKDGKDGTNGRDGYMYCYKEAPITLTIDRIWGQTDITLYKKYGNYLNLDERNIDRDPDGYSENDYYFDTTNVWTSISSIKIKYDTEGHSNYDVRLSINHQSTTIPYTNEYLTGEGTSERYHYYEYNLIDCNYFQFFHNTQGDTYGFTSMIITGTTKQLVPVEQ